jgi:hypothetical protein
MRKLRLHESEGKQIKITLRNGRTIHGLGEWYASALDNEYAENKPGVAHICIGDEAFYEDEILYIEKSAAPPPLAQAV